MFSRVGELHTRQWQSNKCVTDFQIFTQYSYSFFVQTTLCNKQNSVIFMKIHFILIITGQAHWSQCGVTHYCFTKLYPSFFSESKICIIIWLSLLQKWIKKHTYIHRIPQKSAIPSMVQQTSTLQIGCTCQGGVLFFVINSKHIWSHQYDTNIKLILF